MTENAYLSAFNGDLPDEEKILKVVHDYLGNDVGRATKLWQDICQHKFKVFFTDEDILKLIAE